MENDKIKRLNDLIELYRSNTITKEEYEHLKKELFVDTKVEINNDSIKPEIENKISEINKNQNNYQKETFYEANKKILNPILIIVCAGLFYLQLHSNKSQETEEFNTSTVDAMSNSVDAMSNSVDATSNSIETTSNTCVICGNEFHNRGYEEVSEGVWRELDEGNQGQICSPTCGRRHTQQFNDVAKKYGIDLEESETSSSSGDGYKMGNDGRIYEQNKCSLCKGTGIETGHNMAGTQSRICPMCDGRGVRSY
jgi:hypothetical protein